MSKTNQKKIKTSFNKILLLIFLLGLFLRIFSLGSYPLEFHSREALLGWRAESLLSLGQDELGRKWPMIFSALEGYQLPLGTYLLLPFVALFGLDPFGVRLPYALIGSISILALWGIVRFIFPKKKKIAYWSALILAISPWTIILSRNMSFVSLSFSLFLIGYYFFLKIQEKDKLNGFLAFFFLVASLLTDKVSWFLVLPILILTSFFFKKRNFKKGIIFLIIFLAGILVFYFRAPQAKLDFVSQEMNLFNHQSIKTGIDAMRGENLKAGSPLLGRLFYNKLFYPIKWIQNYLKHFNPRFYFISGDGEPHHGLTNFGPILLVFLPFFLAGIGLMFKKDRRILTFLFGWFLLAILPSTLIVNSPDQQRAIFALPVLAIICGYSLAYLKGKYLVIFSLFLIFNFGLVSYDAIYNEPLRFQEKRQIGYQKLAEFIKENGDNHPIIYLTDSYGSDPGPALLFYLNYLPKDFLSDQDSKLVYRHWINQVDKIRINRQNEWRPGGDNLYVIGAEESLFKLIKVELPKTKVIENLSGETVFNFYSNYQSE